ncbi:MAG: family 10 glycosylhydrolase [Oscillospiraceae bacterium]|jgi:uncharacterized lipoprotein YddW (UPF0748 family)|nr:family 10 glycosylhydrolase [Oscillospiraceae bacterium]
MIRRRALPRPLSLLVLLLALTLLPGCPTAVPHRPSLPEEPSSSSAAKSSPAVPGGELRGIWVSYFELTLPKDKSEAAFRAEYDRQFALLESFGLNAVFVHVRPFADSIYPSDLFPWSSILTGTQGKEPGFDPLAVLLELARAHHLQFHAWINPFRASQSDDKAKLSASHPARAHIDANDGWVKLVDGRYYWNPALPEVQKLLLQGVREILERYDVDGVHIDDYFYPTTDPDFDRPQYEAYRTQGGALGLGDWRRENVSAFVAGLYAEVKQLRPAVVVSISPSSRISLNREELYADVERWAAQPGFADWLIPQIYFGFTHEKHPFEDMAKSWADLTADGPTRMAVGLAAYKIGTKDANAGTGSAEWQQSGDILARQVRFLRDQPGCDGFVIFSYQGLFAENRPDVAAREAQYLQELLEPRQ